MYTELADGVNVDGEQSIAAVSAAAGFLRDVPGLGLVGLGLGRGLGCGLGRGRGMLKGFLRGVPGVLVVCVFAFAF